MPSRRPFRPACESLESVELLSAAPLAAAAAVVGSAQTQLALRGSVGGTVTMPLTNPDVGRESDLSGSGSVRPLGLVSLSGTLHATGFIARGHATGVVT